LLARRDGQTSAHVSLDLNLSTSVVQLDEAGVGLPDGRRLPWSAVEAIAESPNTCFVVSDNGEIEKVQTYSEATGRHYSLYPTANAPTMLVSGLPMHRIKDTDPHQDTLAKLRAAAPRGGRVLDICTGLGYTAIAAAEVAEAVITIELDPATEAIVQRNPWSQALLTHPRIARVFGDACQEVPHLETASFSRVIHDPPAFALAGELYSADFYAELYRVLKPGGRLFHYLGDLRSASGSRLWRGVAERLRRVGFQQVTPKPEAFGLVASK
jgi:hypothetical protein